MIEKQDELSGQQRQSESHVLKISTWKKILSKRIVVFAAFPMVLLFLVVVLMILTSSPSSTNQNQTDHSRYSQGKAGLFGQQCEGKGYNKLSTFPLDPEEIELIVPMGRVQDSHVTPTDHQYIIPKETKSGSLVTDNPRKYDIKAPADGYIINIELFKEPVEEAYRKDPYQENYLVVFEHSCDFYIRLIHIDTLSEKVLSSFKFSNPQDQHPSAQTRIPVKEGEVIGTVGPHSFDFQIMDTMLKNKDIISPQNIDFFSSYTVDTFDYLSEPLRSELLKKNLREKEPFGGKIGYDKEGTLLGNWFRVGRDKNNREAYWTNNISIVYDHIDESQIRISFGNFDGYPKAYAVRGNTPDPATIDKNAGLVKYELVQFDYFDEKGNRWDQIHFAQKLTAKNTEERRGVVLFEIQDDGALKVEAFPKATSAEQVPGFTSNAKIYER
ncbi:MAG: hypothetical protein HYT07_00245 [Candidatus Levybacteria bacterium]|nr:hypothetical protein [Candidatus Levybacteria bacterium]